MGKLEPLDHLGNSKIEVTRDLESLHREHLVTETLKPRNPEMPKGYASKI
jgi:hypothetical protein